MSGTRKNKKLLKLKLQNKNSPLITEKISSYFPIVSQETNPSTESNQISLEENKSTKPVETLTNKLDLNTFDDSVFVTKEKPKRQMKLFNCDKNNTPKQKSKKRSLNCDKNVLSRNNSADVDLDHLQMALAMSNSLKDPETSPPNTQQKIQSLRETLQQFGFNAENVSSKICTTKLPTQKRKKKRLFKTTLLFRTEEDRKKIIEEKVAQILSNITLYNEHISKYSTPTEPVDTKPSSFVLREIYNSDSTTYKKSLQTQNTEEYYNSLVNLENRAKVCALLRDWHLIPGREKTPPREINVEFKPCTEFSSPVLSPDREILNENSNKERSVSPELFSEDESYKPTLSPDIFTYESYNEVNNFDLTHSSDDIQTDCIDLTQSSTSIQSQNKDNFEDNDKILKDMMYDVINNSQKSLNTSFDINHEENLDLICDVALLSPNENDNEITNEKTVENEIYDEAKQEILTKKDISASDLENSRIISPDIINYSLNNEKQDNFTPKKLTPDKSDLICISDSDEENLSVKNIVCDSPYKISIDDSKKPDKQDLLNENKKKRNLSISSEENSLALSQASTEYMINDDELNYSSYQSTFKKYDVYSDEDSCSEPENSQYNIETSQIKTNATKIEENLNLSAKTELCDTSNISDNLNQNQNDLDHLANHLAHEKIYKEASRENLINEKDLNKSFSSTFKKYDISSDENSSSETENNYIRDKFNLEKSQIKENLISSPEMELNDVSNMSDQFNCDRFDLDHIADHLAHENIYNSIENKNQVTPIQNKTISRLKASEKKKNVIESTPINGYKTLSSDVVVKTSDVTPMANFNEMDTPDRHKELDKYGLKPMSRGKSVKILEYLYNATHPVCEGNNENNSQTNEPATKKRKLEKKAKVLSNRAVRNRRSQQIIKQDNKEETIALNFALNELKTEDMIFERTFSKKILSCALPFHIAWHNFISSQPALLESILLYEPIWLEDVYMHFKNLGYKYHIQDITTFLDKKCITIRTVQNN